MHRLLFKLVEQFCTRADQFFTYFYNSLNELFRDITVFILVKAGIMHCYL
jgi:hypothetical protein